MLKRITENKLDISKIIDMPLLTTQIIYRGKDGSFDTRKKLIIMKMKMNIILNLL